MRSIEDTFTAAPDPVTLASGFHGLPKTFFLLPSTAL